MSQHFYHPPDILRPTVKSLTVLEEPRETFNRRLVLPEPYPGVLFNFGAPFVWLRDDGTRFELPPVFFSGLHMRPLNVFASGPCRAVGFNLMAWGARALVDPHADLNASPVIPLAGPWLDLAAALRTALDHHGETEAVALLAGFV